MHLNLQIVRYNAHVTQKVQNFCYFAEIMKMPFTI